MTEQTYWEWINSKEKMPTKNPKTKHIAEQNREQKKLLTEIMKADEKDGLYNKQTSVEWLFSQIPFEWSSSKAAFEALQQAKEMDKQQHGQTWDSAIKAHDDRGHVHARSLVDFDEYYNETFNKTQAQ
jgi:hypothetical protein